MAFLYRMVAVLCFLVVGCSAPNATSADTPDAQVEASGDSGHQGVGGASGAGGAAGAVGCGIHTAYPGDDACLPPSTDPSIIRLHYGPSDYTDPVEIAKYTLAAGAETVTCRDVLPSHGAVFVSSYEVSERPGMHHFSLFTGSPNAADLCTMATGQMFLVQRERETTTLGDGAPEYEGAALQVPAGSFIAQAHAINTTDAPILIESWVDLNTVPSTTIPMSTLGLSAGHTMNVAPHSKATIHGAAPAIELPATIVQLVGHFHAHTTEERATAGGKQVYVTNSWQEPGVTWFTSKTGGALVIPPATIAPAGYTGAKVGAFELTPSTSLAWECDVDNTTDLALHYANQALTAEMCNMGGFVLGVRPWTISLP